MNYYTHDYQSGKFPVGDQIIYHFYELLLKKIDAPFWIAGGAITSFLSNEKINDIDLFTKDKKSCVRLIKGLRNKYNLKAYMITDKAIKGTIEINDTTLKVDVVKEFFKDPLQTINMFDFTIACFAVDCNTFYYHKTASFDVLRKKLVINDLPYPISSLRRLQKFIKRGYTACNDTQMEIVHAIRKLNENEVIQPDFYPID